jgi:dUTP pyrophosphatase
MPSTPVIPTISFKRLDPGAQMPTRMTSGAACFDLYCTETVVLKHYRPVTVVGTGIAVQIPEGYVGLVCSRSGLAAKDRAFVLNAPGVIDSDYRGELKVIMGCLPDDSAWPNMNPLMYPAGSRIAQLMVVPLPQLRVVEVDEFTTTTDRDINGLGSTGV